jgi:hypothetical protein
MNRLPSAILAFFALVALSSCDTVVQQSIVRAHMSLPAPPTLPILPLDPDQRLVLQGGLGTRLTQLPPTGVLDDSSRNRLELHLPNTSASGNLFFHYKVLFLGVELSDRQTQVMAGTNIQADGWQLLGWAGGGILNYDQDITYRQMVRTYEGDTTWSLSRDSSGMESSTLVFSAGVSAVFGTDVFRPFVAARILTGPIIDGTGSVLFSNDEPAATNGFDLSQAMLDAGLKIEPTARFHAFVGVGLRTFLDKEIPGADWRLYAGVSIDLVHPDRKPEAASTEEIREAPSRPIARHLESPPPGSDSPVEKVGPTPGRTTAPIQSDSVSPVPTPGSKPAIVPKLSAADTAPPNTAPRTIHFQDAQ